MADRAGARARDEIEGELAQSARAVRDEQEGDRTAREGASRPAGEREELVRDGAGVVGGHDEERRGVPGGDELDPRGEGLGRAVEARAHGEARPGEAVDERALADDGVGRGRGEDAGFDRGGAARAAAGVVALVGVERGEAVAGDDPRAAERLAADLVSQRGDGAEAEATEEIEAREPIAGDAGDLGERGEIDGVDVRRGAEKDGARRARAATARRRRGTSAALVPPKAAEKLERGAERASLGAIEEERGRVGIAIPSPAAAGAIPERSAAAAASASRTPAAPSVCPICALNGCTTGRCSPKSAATARDSIASLKGVDVPCALTRSMRSRGRRRRRGPRRRRAPGPIPCDRAR